ncbi:phasin family protein [Alkalilimnicola sp. S0819]|uniref:phasin family protein n=1 Tax=Alkalilimnicola sp. S0819 TaxID=2613922 RepID=UPI0012627A15|nr:phasin family protein [Alkalilimnicola sp. S0819]KAB7627210.1 phasin family protein [Alkalilimnicola sp. S0819]MPQ15923.1 phasin family protein [Alkalilimnicola sp. S0819]
MYAEIINKTTEQFQQLQAPVKQFNSLVVDHMDKLTQFQLDAAQSYAELGMQNLRAALEVKQPQDLQQYVGQQKSVAETVSKKLNDDATTLVALNKGFVEGVQKLAEEAKPVAAEAPKAKPAARKSAARKSA